MHISSVLLLAVVILVATSCSLCEAAAATTVQQTLLYVFGGEGISIIEPESRTILSTIGAEGVCTRSKNRFSRSNCLFGGATVVKDELVFFSDSPGNRVHVINVEKQKITETIPTEGYPFDLYYLPWLEEVWVHAWTNSTFDVINTAGRLEKTHKAIKAHVQPGWTHGYLYADQQVKDGNVGYVTHLFNPGLHQLDLNTKSYKTFVNMSSYNCTGTFHFVYSAVNKHGFFECLGSNELIELDVSTDNVVRRWNFTGVPYASPDGRFIVVLHSTVNETLNILLSSTVYVLEISGKDSTPTLHPQINITGGVNDLVFRPKANKQNSFYVFISLTYSDKIAVLDLELLSVYSNSDRLTYIEGVGSVKSAPMMHAVGRPIIAGGKWIVSPATADDSVAIINAETRKLYGMVSGVIGGKRIAVVHTVKSAGSRHPPMEFLLAALLFVMNVIVG